MKVVESLEALRYDQPLVLVIGSFDGVHRGHIYLLTQARQRAREHHLAFGIITFDPAPALVLRPGLGDYQITGRDLKVALLAAWEPDLLAVVPFTRELAALTAKQFIDALEDGLQLAELWVGDDFRFGHGREGGIPYLLERARNAEFAVHVVARQGPQAGVPDVSSSAIRDAIHAGNVRLAREMLGRPFELSGVVIRGHGRGRALGYPTANLAIPKEQIVPGAGVYAAIAELPGEPRGVCNTPLHAAAASVGTNPQFGDAETSVEAYLLDFDRDIYDQTLRLLFVERLRDQARFASLDLLCAQIAADVEHTRRIINRRQATGGRR
jgi:riboflavin kinase/FMN adenylyltransferase